MGQDADAHQVLDTDLLEDYCAILSRHGVTYFRHGVLEIGFGPPEPTEPAIGFQSAPQNSTPRPSGPGDPEDFSRPRPSGFDAIFGKSKPTFKKPKPTGSTSE